MAGAQIRRFLILHKELDADDGELTRTHEGAPRLHRRALRAADRRRCYDGSTEADIATEVTFEDGRKGVIAARVKIRDLKPPAAPGAWSAPHEGAGADTAPPAKSLLSVENVSLSFGGVQGAARRLVRHPQGRDPRHHRPQRRRQDVDAERRSTASTSRSMAASPSRARRAPRCGRTKPPRGGIARTFQNVALFSGMTTLDNIMAGTHAARCTAASSGR